MESTLIGFRCRDFAMLAASGTSSHYYIKICDDQDKIALLDSHKMIACCGEDGDMRNFVDIIRAQQAYEKARLHGIQASTKYTANIIRDTLASALRSRNGAYAVNSLLAGFDNPASSFDDTPAVSSLYYLDYLGTLVPVNFGAHGYGATFVTAIFDEQWREDLTPEQGIALMTKCIDEVKRRVSTSNAHFVTKVVSSTGTSLLPAVC